jgi:hypothetical protein
MQIDLDVIFLGGPAPSVDLHDARHAEEPALQNPILDRAQIGQAEVRRPGHLIAVDFADQAGGLNGGRYVVGQTDVLLQIDRGLSEGEVIFYAVIESHADEGEAIE